MKFLKVHGLGNDFILIDARTLAPRDWSGFAKTQCDRHTGIGADGILLVENSDAADVRMRIFNADGSEAEMCGNGIRCFARYVFERKIVQSPVFAVETLAGVMRPRILAEDGTIQVKVDMGEPKLDGAAIPVAHSGLCVELPLEINGRPLRFTSVLMGVPHTYIYVDELVDEEIETLGRAVECAPVFPNHTNVNFVRVIDHGHIEMRTFERGCGRTLACGTGASGASVAGALTGKTSRKIRVSLERGDLSTEWADDNHVYMTGPAEFVFEGELL
ncbi:MAG: diaminopimelate epimerase [Clostridia bacterium]|nr:diaminopimelate epimerase [Clostridia bacterium]